MCVCTRSVDIDHSIAILKVTSNTTKLHHCMRINSYKATLNTNTLNTITRIYIIIKTHKHTNLPAIWSTSLEKREFLSVEIEIKEHV